MNKINLHFADTPVENVPAGVMGEYRRIGTGTWYEIANYDRMEPFLINLSGSGNHWFYISSRGGLSCGRRDADHALFPYYTDDKLHDGADTTGSFTSLIVDRGGLQLWKPFCDRIPRVYKLSRKILKRTDGTAIMFVEENRSLALRFSCSWELSGRFGFIRKSRLENLGDPVEIRYLDGVRNILPSGIERNSQERLSTLLDGYKQAELIREAGMGIYTLGSILTDRAEPSEALRASTVFQSGLSPERILLSDREIGSFEGGHDPAEERLVRGRRGAYLLSGVFSLGKDESRNWLLAADVDQHRGDVVSLIDLINFHKESPREMEAIIEVDIERGRKRLALLVASADGLQVTGDTDLAKRHYGNVLYNIMRGGVYARGYEIELKDLKAVLSVWNRPLLERCEGLLNELPPRMGRRELIEKAEGTGDRDLVRIVTEYLPLTFSRRHGDPSRPWNKFTVDVEDRDGSPVLNYQGNWRDIFQNWEALSFSYPGYLGGIVAKFLNASTADGYNPYRISRNGIDWEVYDPADPWSNIGYWGDHQIVYLGRLLELWGRFYPGELASFLDRRICVAADIPYRIKSFRAIMEDPHNTIIYDKQREGEILQRVEEIGSDGKLLYRSGSPVRFTLLEKLLITILTKLSNLIPGGGVWMNTQRPEWNDANNALAGYGLSVVTAAYLYRFVRSVAHFLEGLDETFSINPSVYHFLHDMRDALSILPDEGDRQSASLRYRFLEQAGMAGEQYRNRVYRNDFDEQPLSLTAEEVKAFLQSATGVLKHTIYANRRKDGLYHSYNVLETGDGAIGVSSLDEMLEGQVAVLASGLLDNHEVESLLGSLRKSRLYRPDQNSYLLYPDRSLPSFLEKNRISRHRVDSFPPLRLLADEGNGELLIRDSRGEYLFSPDIRNSGMLKERVRQLELAGLLPPGFQEGEALFDLYEETFSHRSFTGRSGTFFKYEGLGSIYWHMVSKLQLAVLEQDNPALLPFSREIREGIGAHKSPASYGAFPMDAYSHTPSFSGVQQPGMTGQVKEDIISRFIELGVHIRGGRICFFNPLFGKEELLTRETPFRYIDVHEQEQELIIPAGSVAFTLCAVPVVLTLGSENRGMVRTGKGNEEFHARDGLSRELSGAVFARTGFVGAIQVELCN